MNRKLLSLLVTLVAMFGCLGSLKAQEYTVTLNQSSNKAFTGKNGGVTFSITNLGNWENKSYLTSIKMNKHDAGYSIQANTNSEISWTVPVGYTINFTSISITANAAESGWTSKSFDVYTSVSTESNKKSLTTYENKSINLTEDIYLNNLENDGKIIIQHGDTKMYINTITIVYDLVPNTYTITFDANGGTGTTANVDATYDQDATLTTSGFTKAGYTFTGWNTQADGSGTSYIDGATVKNLTAVNNETVTLYAMYSPKKYELTIKNGFGTFGNNECGIDLTNSNFKAYRAGEVSDTSLKFYQITYLPKGQGAFLMGNDGNYAVSVAASAGKTKDNYMKAGNGSTPLNGYVLASKGTEYPLGFYKTSVAVPEGKAYLEYTPTSPSSVKGFVISTSEFGEDEVTAISIVNAESEENDAYSVTGVKVGGNYRGIVIKNGKKLLQK